MIFHKKAEEIMVTLTPIKDEISVLRGIINESPIGLDRELQGALTKLDKQLDKAYDEFSKFNCAIQNYIKEKEPCHGD